MFIVDSYLGVGVLLLFGVRCTSKAGQNHVWDQSVVEDQESQPLPIRGPPVGHVGLQDLLCSTEAFSYGLDLNPTFKEQSDNRAGTFVEPVGDPVEDDSFLP